MHAGVEGVASTEAKAVSGTGQVICLKIPRAKEVTIN